jgi:transcription initiation factor TFIID subunit 13
MAQRNPGKQEKQYNLTKEMKLALYGFGDVDNPNEDTAEVLEDLMTDYVSTLVRPFPSLQD